MSPSPPLPSDRTLWHITGHGRERHPAGKRYHFDNARRADDGTVAVQLTRGGRITFRDAESTRRVAAGSIMMFRFGSETVYGHDGPLPVAYGCTWVTLNGAGLAEHLGLLARQAGPILEPGLDHPLADAVERLRVLAEPERRPTPVREAAEIQRFVIDLFEFAEDRLGREMPPADRAVRQLLRLPYRPWSLKQLAAEHGISREHLSRRFAQRVGRPAQPWLNEARRRRALALLRQTRLPLAEVARQAGYANAHSFARHVRHATGLSPTAYRRRADP
ncbi:MAG: AraC family transcriptional regulator [Planctomycetota bacterium]